jgi:hypothetical protein
MCPSRAATDSRFSLGEWLEIDNRARNGTLSRINNQCPGGTGTMRRTSRSIHVKTGACLTTQGRALGNAAVGEAVSVMNNSSKQTVDAVVTGALAVKVAAPTASTL